MIGAIQETLPRESRGFHMTFQLVLLEAREVIETLVQAARPTSLEAAMLIRIGLLNYTAGALLMPYDAFLASARSLRHDMEALASRFGVSFEQACNRLSTLQRPGARGVPFFFLRVDPAGNVSKRFAAAAHACAGSCTMPSHNQGRCWSRSPNCLTAGHTCALPEPSAGPQEDGATLSRCMSLRWVAR
jgi:predicted transcriptional regulator